jgi:hypothetical protein
MVSCPAQATGSMRLVVLQHATADDANAADDDLYLVNQRLTAALDGTRQELFDVYQLVPHIPYLYVLASHQRMQCQGLIACGIIWWHQLVAVKQLLLVLSQS